MRPPANNAERNGFVMAKTWIGFHLVFFIVLTVHGWYVALGVLFYGLLSYCIGDIGCRLVLKMEDKNEEG